MTSRLASTLPTAAHDVLGIEQRDTCAICAAPRGIVGYSDPMTGMTRERCTSCGMSRAVPRRFVPLETPPRGAGKMNKSARRTAEQVAAALWAAVPGPFETPLPTSVIRLEAGTDHTTATSFLERAIADGRVVRTWEVLTRQKNVTAVFGKVAR